MNRALPLLIFIVCLFAVITHIYAVIVLLNEQSQTTHLPDHNQSAICGE